MPKGLYRQREHCRLLETSLAPLQVLFDSFGFRRSSLALRPPATICQPFGLPLVALFCLRFVLLSFVSGVEGVLWS
jgi:hypothetical protein